MSAVGSVLATPRWIALTLLAVVALVLCTLAGTWQWTRTQDILALERAALAEPVAVQDITTVDESLPAESVGRPVIVVGRYDGAQQRYVTNRALDGRAGLWVLAPVVLPDGTRVPVLRGWVSEERPVVDAPPDGPVRVEGILQPGETFYAAAPVGPDGRLTAVSDAALRQAWGDGVRTGVVVLAEQAPPSVLGPRPVPPTVGPPDVGFPLQNFFYAFQWWFFAAFVVFAWVRWLWLDVREAQARQPETEAAAAGG
jgi:cytochrome oxidase assembly protein ShyY1